MTDASELHRDDSNAEIARVCSLLESISKRYAEGSAEYKALEDAALAFITVRQNQALTRAFERLRGAFNGELTEEIMARLREHGIEPDDFEVRRKRVESRSRRSVAWLRTRSAPFIHP